MIPYSPGRLYGQRLTVDRKLVSHPVKRNVSLVSCVKVPEDAAAATASKAKSDGELVCLADAYG